MCVPSAANELGVNGGPGVGVFSVLWGGGGGQASLLFEIQAQSLLIQYNHVYQWARLDEHERGALTFLRF